MLRSIKQQLQTQSQRYYRTRNLLFMTGYGKMVAILLYYIIFTSVPVILNYVILAMNPYFSPETQYLIIIVSTVTAITLLFNGAMYFIYTRKIEFFEQYRVNRDRPWPWQQDPKKWRELLWKSIKTTAFYILVVSPILLLISTKIRFDFVMDMSLSPSFVQMLPHFIILHIFEDLFFFSTHWAFHQPFLYKYHKVHHQYNTTVSLAGVYSHILQFLFTNSVPFAIYMKIAGLYAPVHVTTAVIWTILRLVDGYNGHSGYSFSWTLLQLLPFCTNDDYHDFHHSHNSGNYSSQFRFLDTIFGTNKDFKRYKKALNASKAEKAKKAQ